MQSAPYTRIVPVEFPEVLKRIRHQRFFVLRRDNVLGPISCLFDYRRDHALHETYAVVEIGCSGLLWSQHNKIR